MSFGRISRKSFPYFQMELDHECLVAIPHICICKMDPIHYNFDIIFHFFLLWLFRNNEHGIIKKRIFQIYKCFFMTMDL